MGNNALTGRKFEIQQNALDNQFKDVLRPFKKNFEDGNDTGAQLVVYFRGKKVIDLVGARTTKRFARYTADTKQIIYSNGKTISSFAVAWLVDQGKINYDDLVATHWPEFGQNGKDDIKVEDVLRHDSGLAFLSDGAFLDEKVLPTMDRIALAAMFERSKPAWAHREGVEKGARMYHAHFRGFILNEICRRVDDKQRGVREIIQEEVLPKAADTMTNIGVEDKLEIYCGDFKEHGDGDVLFPSVENMGGAIVRQLWLNFRERLGVATEDKYKKSLPQEMCQQFEKISKDAKEKKQKSQGKAALAALKGGQDNRNAVNSSIDGPSYNMLSNARTLAALGHAFILADSPQRVISDRTLELMYSEPLPKMDLFLMFPTVLCKGGLGSFADPKYPLYLHKFHGWQGYGGRSFAFSRELELSIAYIPNHTHVFSLGGFLDQRCLKIMSVLVPIVEQILTTE